MDTLNERSARLTRSALWTASVLALSGCASQPGATSDGPGSGAIGLAHIQLSVDPDALTDEVEYEITGNGILRVKGVMEAIPGTSAIGVIVNLPIGVGYTIRVHTSVGSDGGQEAECSASSMFDVSSSKATELPLTLQCDGLTGSSTAGRAKDAGADAAHAIVTVIPLMGLDAQVGAPANPGQTTQPPAVTTKPDAAVETCEACSKRLCFMVRSIERDRDCYMTSGQILNGPAQGADRAGACVAFLKCAHRTGCGIESSDECYCGPGITTESCIKHGPVGLCRGEYEAAGESWEPADLLGDKLTMRYTVLNAALPLLSCEAARCQASCFPAKR